MPSTNDPLGIQIGAREIYDKLGDVDRKVTDVGGKVDRLSDQHTSLRTEFGDLRAETREAIAELRAETREGHADLESRARVLERGRWPLPSIAALTGVAALIVTLVDLIGKGK
ncbi:hypothetical protein [Actinomadura harenae]|uniref:Uncharacterized protein n=1 Tax=Actinomadura harenae TaxID=2483351 RepID=A0A3M2MG46_9ACTN|nr:hypothetical protein [Actinomadura harenae]RMI47615.1 hypothetical protein EBO15_01555 [Actinomadura harenae]